MAAVLQEANPTKYSPEDWNTSNMVIQSSAERQRNVTHNLRQESHRSRNETDIRTRWKQYSNDTRLHERISDISDWKADLERTLSDTEREMDQLSTTKKITECAFDAKAIPWNVVMECLNLREGRMAIDSVRDEVEAELKKEVEVVEGVRTLLHQRINEAFEQLCILQECHSRLHKDVTDKHSALDIDTTCRNLTNKSDRINLQTDPTRIMKGIVSPVQWDAFSSHNTTRAEEEMQRSTRLREAIHLTLQQTTDDLERQWAATNYAFRKRIHEMQLTKQELEWQRDNTEAEIEKVSEEIKDVETALNEKTPPMMVAHTRLENRTQRPNVELCRDKPQYELVEELASISECQQELLERFTLAKQSLGTLQRTLQRINDDITIKTTSLAIDSQCFTTREKLAQHPKVADLPALAKEK